MNGIMVQPKNNALANIVGWRRYKKSIIRNNLQVDNYTRSRRVSHRITFPSVCVWDHWSLSVVQCASNSLPDIVTRGRWSGLHEHSW